MNNLNKLIEQLQLLMENHSTVKRFRFDFEEQLDNFAQLDNSYPLVFVSPFDTFTINNENGYSGSELSLEIFVLDRIKEDRSNILTIQNETQNIINDILIFFKNANIQITTDDFFVEPINNAYSHNLSGRKVIVSFLIDSQTDCVAFNDGSDCEDGTVLLNNSLDDIKRIRVPSGGETVYNIVDSVFNLTIKDKKGNEYGTFVYDIPAFSETTDELELLINSELNIQNSNGSYIVDIDDDFILPDTDIEIEIKDKDGNLLHDETYNLPSAVDNGTKSFIIQDSVLNLTIKDTNGSVLETKQYNISPESIENDTIILEITGNVEVNIKNSDNSFNETIDEDYTLPDTKFNIVLKNSEHDIVDDKEYIKPSIGDYTEEIKIDDITINVYIEDTYKDSIDIIYPKK